MNQIELEHAIKIIVAFVEPILDSRLPTEVVHEDKALTTLKRWLEERRQS